MAIAHFNLARLRGLPGDPLVAEFVDNTVAVNALAEAAPGFIWRWSDDGGQVAGGVYEGIAGDPYLAASLSVWSDVGALREYVYRSLHGDFFRRRAAWFVPMPGPTYVLWPCKATDRPTVSEGLARLDRLRQDGPGPQVQDFAAALRLMQVGRD